MISDNKIQEKLETWLPRLKELRRTLHQYPELGYEEWKTAERVQSFFQNKPGVVLETGVAGTGVVVTFGKELSGPAVALRADMDALLVEEVSDVPYRSQQPGKMHACGHDGHTAILVGVGCLLMEMQEALSGPVRLIFQPAEEGGGGAKRMCEAGVLKDPDICAVFGLHNMPSPDTTVGQIALCSGPAMAGTGVFKIEIQGMGGHAAFPHACIDPIVIGSEWVTHIQTLVSRMTDPTHSAVVSVTQFHAGSAHNVIPDKATLAGTFRALDPEVLKKLRQLIPERAEAIARMHGAEAQVNCEINYPVLINHPKTDSCFQEIVRKLGREKDLVQVPPILAGEDFAFYQQEVPGTFWFLPSRPPEKSEVPFCHHPSFDFNDDVIADGVQVTLALALNFAEWWLKD